MDEEDDSGQHRHVLHPEHAGHQPIGERDRGQPEQAHGHAEGVGRPGGDRQENEQRDGHSPSQVDPGEQPRL